MKPEHGQFWRVETISGDYSHGLRLFAEWPAGFTAEQADAAQVKVAKLLSELETEANSTK